MFEMFSLLGSAGGYIFNPGCYEDVELVEGSPMFFQKQLGILIMPFIAVFCCAMFWILTACRDCCDPAARRQARHHKKRMKRRLQLIEQRKKSHVKKLSNLKNARTKEDARIHKQRATKEMKKLEKEPKSKVVVVPTAAPITQNKQKKEVKKQQEENDDDDQIQALFKVIDVNSDGELSKAELLQAVTRRRMKEPALDLLLQSVSFRFPALEKLAKPGTARKALLEMDTGKDGTVNVYELVAFCRATETMPMAKLEKMGKMKETNDPTNTMVEQYQQTSVARKLPRKKSSPRGLHSHLPPPPPPPPKKTTDNADDNTAASKIKESSSIVMQEMLRLKQRIKKLKNVKKTRRNKKVRRGIFNSVMSADHDHDEFGHGVTSIGEMGDDFALVSKKANNVTNEDRISFLRKKWKTQLAPPSRPLRESVEFRMDGLGERVRTQTMVVHPLYPLGITWEATVEDRGSGQKRSKRSEDANKVNVGSLRSKYVMRVRSVRTSENQARLANLAPGDILSQFNNVALNSSSYTMDGILSLLADAVEIGEPFALTFSRKMHDFKSRIRGDVKEKIEANKGG